MPTPRKTQKQIAQRYAGNLQYYRLFHPLRKLRLLIAFSAIIVAIIIAFFYISFGRSSPRLEWFNSSGAISQVHAGFGRDCKQCHDPKADVSLLKSSSTMNSIDLSCERCHTQHTFHQVNVTVDHSCTACHHEHLGARPMQPVKDINCRMCHGDAALMAASAEKGTHFPPEDFHVAPKGNLVYFQPPRPAQGYTQVFESFADGHPDFQIQRDHLSDPNTLKFNHEKHLSGDIPLVNGHKLNCAYCHQPDAQGAYMQPISFERNCQACHTLQIDPTLPNFQIPHPKDNTDTVRNFILTLPTQYASYAADKMGLTEPAEIDAFVAQHMKGIQQRTRQGTDLIKEVFYSDQRHVNFDGSASSAPADRSLFPGCAYCHEVKTSLEQEPVVTNPVTPDRWFVHARFSHVAHGTMNCEACHGQALHSSKTSDILMPDQASCVTCHSPKGRVVSTCVTCHGYHNKDPLHGVTSASSLQDTAPAKP